MLNWAALYLTTADVKSMKPIGRDGDCGSGLTWQRQETVAEISKWSFWKVDQVNSVYLKSFFVET